MTVAQDGSGDHKTISDAIKNIPSNYTNRYVIYVKAGVYDEMIIVPKEKENLTMYGDGMDKTIITGNLFDSDSMSKLESPFG
jgi:pectin methylesterase-like acyl-CoA thioesterase